MSDRRGMMGMMGAVSLLASGLDLGPFLTERVNPKKEPRWKRLGHTSEAAYLKRGPVTTQEQPKPKLTAEEKAEMIRSLAVHHGIVAGGYRNTPDLADLLTASDVELAS